MACSCLRRPSIAVQDSMERHPSILLFFAFATVYRLLALIRCRRHAILAWPTFSFDSQALPCLRLRLVLG